MNEAGQTVCLSMIVRNESHVIRRCLESVLPLLDSWVIVDTGSSDGTQQVIREYLKDVPGELYERPWVDFAHNRTEALQLARGRATYQLVIDADEYLETAAGWRLPRLEADAYTFEIRSGSLAYLKTQLLRDALEWCFIGVLHEYPFAAGARREERLPGVITRRIQDGARSKDPLKYRRDALLLEEALLKEPDNPRTMFYLAQSYADAGEIELAIDRYRRRVALGGWEEEVWYAQYQVARLLQLKKAEWPGVLTEYLAAFALRTARAEPLFQTGLYYSAQQQFQLAYFFLSQASALSYPVADVLFIDRHIYEVLLPLEFSVVCFYVGRHEQAIAVAQRLLENAELTPAVRGQVEKNLSYSVDALAASA